MNGEHVGENAGLYALGALSETEMAAVRAHLRECPDCTRLVGEAERDVATLAAAQPEHVPPPELQMRVERLFAPRRQAAWPSFAAIAAAFVIGLLPSLYLWESAHRAASANAVRMTAFHSSRPELDASVTYARNGSWYVVVVRGAPHALQVAWMHDGTHTMLGNAVPHGGLATLYLPKSHRMERLALMDGAVVVADAQLPY